MTAPITIRLPSKYAPSPAPPFTPPSLPFLRRTWTVTHSTLSMWRSARNVRITYGPLSPARPSASLSSLFSLCTSNSSNSSSSPSSSPSSSAPAARDRISDLVEYEPVLGGRLKCIAGVDTASAAGDAGAWDWRGTGLLFWVGSHWEVLGWGERAVPSGGGGEDGEGGGEGGEVERWVVTWFAPTAFTAEGVDVYSDRRDGGSKDLMAEVLAQLGRVTEGKGRLGEIVARDMREVAIQLPWKER